MPALSFILTRPSVPLFFIHLINLQRTIKCLQHQSCLGRATIFSTCVAFPPRSTSSQDGLHDLLPLGWSLLLKWTVKLGNMTYHPWVPCQRGAGERTSVGSRPEPGLKAAQLLVPAAKLEGSCWCFPGCLLSFCSWLTDIHYRWSIFPELSLWGQEDKISSFLCFPRHGL